MKTHKLPTVNLKELTEMAIKQVYRTHPGIYNKEVAKLLGVSERNLYRWLNKMKLTN